ncbi:MAG TPA: metalloregulator ArsR/SmtB family transcription factor [Pyrinomonadaceae bacterium]|nr:metalloregulator ArsR/SmtB family transcription factor [Pyrinomonadaceae bacterium]
MPNEEIDRLFYALGDPTRRAVVERLSSGPAAVKELAAPFTMALPSFTQHLGVLEKSGLVRSEKSGRVRTYYLVPKKLKAAESWLETNRKMWKKRLDQLDNYLLTLKEK